MQFRSSSLALAAGLVATVAAAHPHFNKTVTVVLPGGAEAKISYNTTSANEELAHAVAVGEFATPRRPVLELSADVSAGGTAIAAGEYTIGVVRKGENEWVMALHPGRLGRGDQPDSSKLIELDSHFSTSMGTAEHMLIDVTPGSGEGSGQVLLTLHFGSMFLSGTLS
jgi:hypothetical protein